MPYFSVIIPLYNKERFVVETLKSVLAQSFTDFEVLIINDGSTDLSEEKIFQFKDNRIRYFAQKNQGVSKARNFGIEMASSEYITFIDADDYWYPYFLQEMFLAIAKYPEQKIFAGAIETETSQIAIPAQYSIQKEGDYQIVNYFQASNKTSVLWTSCAVFHKNIFLENGVFDANLKSGQDTDLWIRIGLIYPIVFCWKILARYVYDADSLSKKTKYIPYKLDFSKFSEAEKTNPSLKKFLDLNRFSFAIKSKMNGDENNFERFKNAISYGNLSLKKRILLELPAPVLKSLLELNLLLVRVGLSKSVFK